MKNSSILIVDDNKSVLRALELLLRSEFKTVDTVTSPKQIPSLLEKNIYDVVLLDMNFTAGVNTGNEGLFWLKRILEIDADSSVIMITAYGDVELAVKAVKEGAVDFILKPWDNHKLISTVHAAYKLRCSRNEVSSLKNREQTIIAEFNRERKFIIGNSPELTAVLNMVRKVAATDANVLITGENGTGKELIAAELHRLSTRNQELLVSVDMGAIADTLFESELFGHVKGAFTDAHTDKAGKFEAANKGTLFLDEIGNLPLSLQAKLLAVLQNREICRVGSTQPIPIDIRLICATNSNLDAMVANGSFRQDLLYRINTIHVEVPPLRNRIGDVEVLADFFLQKFASKYGKPGLQINEKAMDKLKSHHWPGNVRELQHTVEKAIILSDSKVLRVEDFPLKSVSESLLNKTQLSLDEMERQMILNAVNRHEGNFSAAAKQLGITRQTLYNKMKKYDLE